MMSAGTADGLDQGQQGTISLFAPITAPVLRSVDPVQVVRFLKERERYELEIESKQAEVPSLKVLPFTASVDRSLLKNLFYMGKFDDHAPDAATFSDLTSNQIKAYIDSIVARPTTVPSIRL